MNRIVFLDTHYLVNLAKLRRGQIGSSSDQSYFAKLDGVLRRATESGKFITPICGDQLTESSLDSRIFSDVFETVRSVSGGFRFLTDWDIIDDQILGAAKAFRGMQGLDESTQPVIRDPGFLGLFSTDEYALHNWSERHRSDKKRFAEHARHYYSTVPAEFDDARDFLISCYINDHLTRARVWRAAKRMQSEDAVDGQIGWMTLVRLVELWRNLERLGVTISDDVVCTAVEILLKRDPRSAPLAWQGLIEHAQLCERLSGTPFDLDIVYYNPFLESAQLINIPYFQIKSSLEAAYLLLFPQRRFRPSDYFDLELASAYLPYCTLFTTDAFVKEVLVNRLHLDKRYRTTVYSGQRNDRESFLANLESLL